MKQCQLCYERKRKEPLVYLPTSLSYMWIHKKCAELWVKFVQTKDDITYEQYIEWYNAVDKETKAIMEKRDINQYINKNTNNVFVCKTPDCPFWCELNNRPNCKWLRCILCKKMQRIEKREYINDQDAFQTITGYRQCPTCRIIVEKTGGCPIMFCENCGTEFNFHNNPILQKPLTKKDHSDVINLLGYS